MTDTDTTIDETGRAELCQSLSPEIVARPASLFDVQERHDALLEQAIRLGRHFTDQAQIDEEFLRDVGRLLRDMNRLSEEAESFDEYRWLSDAAIKWQVIFNAALNLPKTVQLPLPRRLLPPQPPATSLTEEEIEHLLRRNAEYFAYVRIAKSKRLIDILSSPEEQRCDSHQAAVYLASDVLDGKINFPSRIGPSSYWRLQQIWIEEVKQLRAYCVWEHRGGKLDVKEAQEDYYQSGDGLRARLADPGIKGQPSEFGVVMKFLEESYLTDGRALTSKPHLVELIKRKAERIAEVTGRTSESDAFQNWVDAESYVTMFYESIIPAVMKNEPESVLMVLKAFQFSKAPENSWRIIDAFEVALVTFFVNPESIRLLWAASKCDPIPISSVQSSVAVESWPKLEIPPDCIDRFSFDGRRIVFKGVMTELQRRSLLEPLTTIQHRKSLNELFQQSRIIHEETTL